MSRLMDIKDLVQLLTAQIETLCQQLLPDGHREGNDWIARNPLRDDHTPGSFRICVRGAKAGVWKDFATDDAGDALDLVAYLGQLDKKDACAWARRWLGLEGEPPEVFKQRKRQAEAERRRRDAAAAKDREDKRGIAQALYLSAQVGLAGTPAARYLEGRGLDLALLPREPRALRYHPELYNHESERKWPGLVAAISGPDGTFFGVHRTWLQVHRDGRVTKAPLKDAKMTLGAYKGGCIRLWKGEGNKPLAKVPPGSSVTLTEGIEDGLTVALADPSRMVLVGVSLSAMSGLVLPPNVSQVTIAAQNDSSGSAADQQLARVVQHFVSEGRTVRLFRPPPGVKDVNDLLNLRREEGVA